VTGPSAPPLAAILLEAAISRRSIIGRPTSAVNLENTENRLILMQKTIQLRRILAEKRRYAA
jgi:hypothetical protein